MKPVLLILGSVFLSLSAFADVATISGSNNFNFETIECDYLSIPGCIRICRGR
jgi:hypothetical protein